jgi:hypothetical protein
VDVVNALQASNVIMPQALRDWVIANTTCS